MLLDVRHLQLIAAIADAGGVTKAGERLNLSQSALSCRLKEAERRLGTLLFQRIGRRLVLTASGDRLLRSARVILDELSSAEGDLQALAASPPRTVRVATECFTCYTWLPPVLERLHRKAVEIEVILAAEHTRSPVPALLRGDLDVAVITGPNSDRRLQLTPLFVDEMIAAVPQGHRLAGRRWLEAADLESEHLVTFDAPREQLTLFSCVMDPARLTPARHTRMQLSEAMMELVRAGMGIAVVPRWVAAAHPASSRMRLVRLTRKGIWRRWNAATLRGRSVPDHVLEFAAVLAEEIQQGSLLVHDQCSATLFREPGGRKSRRA